MNVKITPKALSGSIEAIPSKSHVHRLILASALSDIQKGSRKIGAFALPKGDSSDDICATATCAKQLLEKKPVFNCKESGSTLRFLLPVAMALKDNAVFIGEGRLPKRPMDVLTQQMTSHGCAFSLPFKKAQDTTLGVNFSEGFGQPIFSVSGRLLPGDFYLPGNISSQYVTGLLFALPLLQGDSRILITSSLESSSYVDMTIEVLRQFHIETCSSVSRRDVATPDNPHIIQVPGNQRYEAPAEILEIDGDWSNGAFWLAAGALGLRDHNGPTPFAGNPGSGIACEGLSPPSLQGDRQIVDLIRKFGGRIDLLEKSYVASGGNLLGIDIDASEIPDLVPVLAVLACGAIGTTKIYNAARLRIKESDRLAAVADCLKKLGADMDQQPDGLIIRGKGSLAGGIVNSYNDHRIAMAMAVASVCCEKPVIIENAQAVSKSYPCFWKDFEKLGGTINAF